MSLRLRVATPADRSTLEYWDTKEHVNEASGDDDVFDWVNELPRTVSWREFLIAEVDQRPIGFIQIIDPKEEETHYWGDAEPHLRAIDIWIGEEADLGRGYGTTMMELALERCFAPQDVRAVLIDPLVRNEAALRFYERIGFKRIARRTFGTDDCYVYRIERLEWKKE